MTARKRQPESRSAFRSGVLLMFTLVLCMGAVSGSVELAQRLDGLLGREAVTLKVDNVAALANLTTKLLRDGQLVEIAGRITPGDCGGQTVYWDEGSSTTANGITVFDELSGGRFKSVDTATINIKQGGARGDGVTDDRAAIQACVALATNGKIFIPPGTFIVSSPGITIDEPMTIEGVDWQGSILQSNAQGYAVLTFTEHAGNTNRGQVHAKNFQVKIPDADEDSIGIHCLEGTEVLNHVYLERVYVLGDSGSKLGKGIVLENCLEGGLKDCYVRYFDHNLEFSGSGGGQSNAMTITGCLFREGQVGIYGEAQSVQIIGGTIEGNSEQGIYSTGGLWTVCGVHFEQVAASHAGVVNWQLSGDARAASLGNTFYGTAADGKDLYVDSSATSVKVASYGDTFTAGINNSGTSGTSTIRVDSEQNPGSGTRVGLIATNYIDATSHDWFMQGNLRMTPTANGLSTVRYNMADGTSAFQFGTGSSTYGMWFGNLTPDLTNQTVVKGSAWTDFQDPARAVLAVAGARIFHAMSTGAYAPSDKELGFWNGTNIFAGAKGVHLQRTSDTEIAVQNSSDAAGALTSRYAVASFTIGGSLNEAQCAGQVYNNTGASGECTIVLPPAAAGMRVAFVCTAAQDITLDCDDADKIEGTSAVGGRLSSDQTIGSRVFLFAPDATNWLYETPAVGTWTDLDP